MKHFQNIAKFLAVTILLFGIISCSPEKKLAMDFASRAKTKNILILSPQFLYKTNLKTYLLDSIAHGLKDNNDSILLLHSDYLAELNDSLFIANYMLGYKKTLSKIGFRIFDEEQMDSFMSIDSNTYQVNIAQIELEETIYTYRDEAEVFDSYYYHDHNLNAVYVNSWFEFSYLDKVSSKQQIYFTTDLITDLPEGTFDYDIFSGKVRYMYNIDSLKVNDLYGYAYRIGQEYAKYTFDMLLNQELDNKLIPDQRSEKYWRFDPSQFYFYPATDDRFVPLD